MTNSTDVYWDIAGVSLQTYAWNITTLGGSRMKPASLRGENRTVPFRQGQVYVPKLFDSRVISLSMWVLGAEQDGSRPTDETMRSQFDENWGILADLMSQPGQFALTKRWRDQAGTLLSATALAEYAGGLEPEMTGPYRAQFDVDLMLADPWFYSAEVSFAVPSSPTIQGNAPTERIRIEMAGDDGKIAWAGGARWLQVLGPSGGGGGNMWLYPQDRYVTRAGVYHNDMVRRDNTAPDWMTLTPGTMAFTLPVGAAATIWYYPAWR